MSKHTPAPWAYNFESIDPEWAVVITSSGRVVANVNADFRQAANARLIAAAPVLLEALKSINERFSQAADAGASIVEAYDSFYRDLVQDAINKATGEKS